MKKAFLLVILAVFIFGNLHGVFAAPKNSNDQQKLMSLQKQLRALKGQVWKLVIKPDLSADEKATLLELQEKFSNVRRQWMATPKPQMPFMRPAMQQPPMGNGMPPNFGPVPQGQFAPPNCGPMPQCQFVPPGFQPPPPMMGGFQGPNNFAMGPRLDQAQKPCMQGPAPRDGKKMDNRRPGQFRGMPPMFAGNPGFPGCPCCCCCRMMMQRMCCQMMMHGPRPGMNMVRGNNRNCVCGRAHEPRDGGECREMLKPRGEGRPPQCGNCNAKCGSDRQLTCGNMCKSQGVNKQAKCGGSCKGKNCPSCGKKNRVSRNANVETVKQPKVQKSMAHKTDDNLRYHNGDSVRPQVLPSYD